MSVLEILIHEAVHIWQRNADHMEEDKPSKEFEAYAIEKIASELIKEYGQRLKRRARKDARTPR